MAGRPWGSQGAARITGESGGVMVLWAASGSTRGKVVSLLASRSNSVWQQSLLTHLAHESVATNHRIHLASWGSIFCAWYPDSKAARLAQGIFSWCGGPDAGGLGGSVGGRLRLGFLVDGGLVDSGSTCPTGVGFWLGCSGSGLGKPSWDRCSWSGVSSRSWSSRSSLYSRS